MSSPQQCSYEGCSEAAWSEDPNGLCLYHSPENGSSAKTARAVWARAQSKTQACDSDFRGWHFPANPDQTSMLILSPFPASLDNRLDGATFEDEIWIKVTCGRLCCCDAVFKDKAVFLGSFSIVRFDRAQFHGLTHFTAGSIHEGAVFNEATFHADVSFGSTEFHYHASFEGTTFKGNALFAQATFRNWASWRNARFEGMARFGLATFENNVNFAGARFAQFADFSGASIQQSKDIVFDLPPGVLVQRKRRSGATPFAGPEQGETAYRLAKEAAQSRGDYRHAGEYHYAEQCAIGHGKRKRYGRKVWHWLPELVFARGVFGYGERPHHALVAGIAVILLFAALCWLVGGISPNAHEQPCYSPTVAQCLYFSIVTFTTLGYGDLAPKPHFRPWAGLEALLGALLIAVFIVGLTRKYMR